MGGVLMNKVHLTFSKNTRRRLRSIYYRVSRIDGFYRICRRYVAAYEGNCDSDMNTNGELRLLGKALTQGNPGDILFDVGAHVGTWTREALRLSPDKQLHLFEPSPRNFHILNQQNFPANVHLNPIALGAVKGISPFFLHPISSQQDSLYESRTVGQEAIAVHKETLADYCAEKCIDHILFLKIDTEGNDLEVLRGAHSFLAQEKIDIIQFEYGPKNIESRIFFQDIFEFLKPYNYSLFKIKPFSISQINSYHETLDHFLLSNYILVSKQTNFSMEL